MVPKIGCLSSWGTKVVLKWPSGGPLKYHFNTPRIQVPHLRYPFLPIQVSKICWLSAGAMSERRLNECGRGGAAIRKKRPQCAFIVQKGVPKIGHLSSWGTQVVIKNPSGGPGAGQSPAPGPPKGHLSTTLVPHELRYPILSTLFP